MKKSNHATGLSGFFLNVFVLSFLLLSFLLLSLVTFNVQAHTLDITSAQFQWKGGHYSMKLKLDWLNYLEQRLESEQYLKSDRHLELHLHIKKNHSSMGKSKLSLLSEVDLQVLLGKSQHYFRQHAYLTMDNKRYSLEKIVFPTAHDVRAMAQKKLALKIIKKRSSVHHDATSFLTIEFNGNVKNPGKHLSILFPKEIGPVLMTFSSPKSQMQKAGKPVTWALNNGYAIVDDFLY